MRTPGEDSKEDNPQQGEHEPEEKVTRHVLIPLRCSKSPNVLSRQLIQLETPAQEIKVTELVGFLTVGCVCRVPRFFCVVSGLSLFFHTRCGLSPVSARLLNAKNARGCLWYL